jgi:hypothetical protein
MAEPRTEHRAELELVLAALRRYPRPVRAEGASVYRPPLLVAVGLYAQFFQKSTEEAVIAEAFAAVLPKVLGRCRAHISAAMNAIVDGAPESLPEYLDLVSELSTLATMFVGRAGDPYAGPHAPQYVAVCEMVKALRSASPGAP